MLVNTRGHFGLSVSQVPCFLTRPPSRAVADPKWGSHRAAVAKWATTSRERSSQQVAGPASAPKGAHRDYRHPLAKSPQEGGREDSTDKAAYREA